MRPRSPWGRRLLTAVLVLHLGAVADGLAGYHLPGSKLWLRATQTNQSWEMFGHPRPRGWTMETWGIRRDSERVLVVPSVVRRPGEQYFRWRYRRTVKLQINMAKKSGRKQRKPYAHWVCTENPELRQVELLLYSLDRPTMEEYRRDQEPEIEWSHTKTLEYPCP